MGDVALVCENCYLHSGGQCGGTLWVPRGLYFEGKRWIFAQIKEDVDRCARGLIQLGVKPVENVALWMPNRPEWIHMFFALVKVI